jgi:hypothetical protein
MLYIAAPRDAVKPRAGIPKRIVQAPAACPKRMIHPRRERARKDGADRVAFARV